MRLIFLLFIFIFSVQFSFAQTPKSNSSSEILQQLKKLSNFGSVLYIAAHPDDENTRLLAYLASEKRYRTGYLSLTRGDGGQNLIGDEQGIDLGLIRTQELLAARRIDGAEQFFSRAYDFGFSKSPEEALRIWDHDKILSDVVWVIRKFRPDVIITRFPTTGEGGHGHHTASAILAGEAFEAAADSTKFAYQFNLGVTVWQAKRLLWNTFNFGGNNTTRADQLQIDAGTYSPILGKSYGEIAAESRSQHKSQGFGVPAQRGKSIEYFSIIKGASATNDLMDNVDISSGRIFSNNLQKLKYDSTLNKIISEYDASNPQKSILALQDLERLLNSNKDALSIQKRALIEKLILDCSGIFIEAIADQQLTAIGDTMKLNLYLNNRDAANLTRAQASFKGEMHVFNDYSKNIQQKIAVNWFVKENESATQPYWLEKNLTGGAFAVENQQKIGKPEDNSLLVSFQIYINGEQYLVEKPIQFKYTDPVKGEIYEPIQIIYPAFVNNSNSILLFKNNNKNEIKTLNYGIQANVNLEGKSSLVNKIDKQQQVIFDSVVSLKKGESKNFSYKLNGNSFSNNSTTYISAAFKNEKFGGEQHFSLRKISYDHIPQLFYNYVDQIKVVKLDLKTSGTRAGYIAGAGDKVPDALKMMGYTVDMLSEKDLTSENLKKYDVIVTGVRAYNIHTWLNNAYDNLMKYVEGGGVLFVQYNTNNAIGPVKAKIAPYPFTISRNRITDETAVVNFLLPNHPALNFPNKITANDFEGWIQERSTYHAEDVDNHYQKIFSMSDPGEKAHDGSLIIADYGKGRFVYSGLVFFRELPAGVPGAYRLFANLIATTKKSN